jgi:hypothetical protein
MTTMAAMKDELDCVVVYDELNSFLSKKISIGGEIITSYI